jgi:hypothetical protein
MADGGQITQVQVSVRAALGREREVADVTQAYLCRWGQWLRQGGAGAQGWAHATAEGRLRRDGTLICGRGGARSTGDDPVAERIDRMIARLGADDRRWPLMMRYYYGSDEATHATVASALAGHFGEAVSAASVRGWLREAAATVRGELRGAGLA